MAVLLAGRVAAVNVDAPAAAATYTSPSINLRRAAALGDIALGSVFDAFIFHEGQNFTYFVEGSDDNVTFFTLATAAVAGHVAGAAGTLLTLRVPANWVRIKITNTGGAPATNFRVWGSAGVL